MYKEYKSKFGNDYQIYGKEGTYFEGRVIAKAISLNGVVALYDNYAYLEPEDIRYVAEVVDKIKEELNSKNNG